MSRYPCSMVWRYCYTKPCPVMIYHDILYLHLFFHDNSTNKVFRYSRYQVSKLLRNNDVFRKWYLSHSHDMRDHEYHCPQIYWLTWTKSCRSHTLVRKGESVKISKQEVDKSKEEVKVGEYWQTVHLPPVVILSCPFGICF